MKKGFFLLILVFIMVFVFYLVYSRKNAEGTGVEEGLSLKSLVICKDFPETNDDGQVVKYNGFALEYNESCEQPGWVMYLLTRNMVKQGNIKRKDHFREDPHIISGSAIPSDYRKCGYDKGHMCPAADMEWSEETMDETFYMSNMSPQEPAFNRGIWKELEEKVREWAVDNDSIVIITGPVLKGPLKSIGNKNKVCVPLLYYKIIADVSSPTYKIIAFVMKNEGSGRSIYDFAVPEDSVERLTGFRFFPGIKGIETLEKKIDVDQWK